MIFMDIMPLPPEITTEKVEAIFPIPFHPRQPMRPVVRVMDQLIWPDGFARPITRWERLMIWCRWPRFKVKPPSDVERQLHRFVAVGLENRLLFGDATPTCPATSLPCLSVECRALGCQAPPSEDNDDENERR